MLPTNRYLRWALLVLLGAMAGLGQAPQGWWVLTLVALALWLRWPDVGRRAGFGAGWWFGLGYFAVSLRWIVSPFLVDAATTGWMAPFGLLAMAAGGAVFWGLARWVAYRLAPQSMLLLAVLLAVAEATRSLILTGFPWALIGHIWIDTPLAQLAAWGGPHLLSVVTVLLAWSIALLLGRHWWAIAGPLLAVSVGWAMTPPPVGVQDGPMVRILQPNASQSEKWDPIQSQIFLARLTEMTGQGARPDLIVWPETSVPSLLAYADDDLNLISDAARGAPVILGINRQEGARYYNAALVLGAGGQVREVYDKAHIVPFGEYVPGGDLLARFGVTAFSSAHGRVFSAGAGPATVEVPGLGPARILICYEGIFAEEIGTATRPRLMVLITNDAWFGVSAGPRQHLAQARLRAIEQGLPMARSANTGISAMIDPYGRVLAKTDMNEVASLDAILPDALSPTPYSRFGDGPVWFTLFLICACTACVRRRF